MALCLLGLEVATNEIEHDIRVSQTFCYLCFVPDIPFLDEA